MAEHFHAYLAPAEGRAGAFTCRAVDTFRTRAAAHRWAAEHRPAERRFIRRCNGGPSCPGPGIPDADNNRELGKLRALPAPRKRKRRPARLVRIRKRLDELAADRLQELEAWLDQAAEPQP